jgi:hypothetical protein
VAHAPIHPRLRPAYLSAQFRDDPEPIAVVGFGISDPTCPFFAFPQLVFTLTWDSRSRLFWPVKTTSASGRSCRCRETAFAAVEVQVKAGGSRGTVACSSRYYIDCVSAAQSRVPLKAKRRRPRLRCRGLRRAQTRSATNAP